MNLKPCPCGKTPTELSISGQHDQDKWPTVTGCCGEWEVSFKNPHHLDINGEEVAKLGREAWNDAPRPTDAVTIPRVEYDRMVNALQMLAGPIEESPAFKAGKAKSKHDAPWPRFPLKPEDSEK